MGKQDKHTSVYFFLKVTGCRVSFLEVLGETVALGMAQPIQGKKGETGWLGRDTTVCKGGKAGVRLFQMQCRNQ